MSIVIIKDGDAVTTTLAIADGCEVDHASVIKLVRTYQPDLEEFGLLDFKSESTGGRPTEYAFLNDQQSTLLLTYMRNTEIVRAFKKKLVREFWEMVQQRSQTAPALPQDFASALRLAADLEDQKAALALENQQQAAKIESLEDFFMAGETPFQFVKRLNGVNCSLISHTLMEMRWVFNDAEPEARPHYRVYSRSREKKWLTEKPRTIRGEGQSTFIRYDLVLLIDGAKKLHDLYMSQKLPMKKTWDGRFSYIKFTPESSR
ncbi:Rha family transcriptional regulator [Pseudomonas abietaniphila]|uniref:Rha family transcriptional regulator n=1 Tax=Pseudomonas abietaniphila TaxID=89065 RepID=UPI000783DFFF|nr:Rha family transcriptional regulator [Pseudomonas abietaniphila]